MNKKIFCATVIGLMVSMLASADDYSVSSPNGKLTATIHLVDGKLTYEVANDTRTIVKESPLGLKTASVDLTEGLTYVGKATQAVDDAYTLPTGKTRNYRDHCNVLAVTTQKDGWRLNVQFRVYDDGFAFRYNLPKYGTNTYAIVTGEASRVRVNTFSYCLGQKFIGNTNNPNYPYEGTLSRYTWAQLTSLSDKRLNAPALISNGTDYLLMTEADNRGIFSSALLSPGSIRGEFAYLFAGDSKDYETTKDQSITGTLPLKTPWRMVVIGDLPTIFETTMTENLCPPTELTDIDWIRPGRAAWYWGGSDGNTTANRESYGGLEAAETRYAELAAELGYEYTTIDGGWSSNWVQNVIQHANKRGVHCFLWQTARLSDNTSFANGNMESTLQQWAKWGVEGIKIDFWEDDSKETMIRMENLLKLAAKYHMVVDFHGCTRPSGLRRTYPNLLSQEGILGGENDFWRYKQISPEHHLNLLFTRCVVGASDYTPGDIASHEGNFFTNASLANRLSLMTAIETGILHLNEAPCNLQYFMGLDIIKRVPVTWDETHLLEGAVQQYATIARRNGEDWWVSALTVEARNEALALNFLPEGKQYTAYLYRDGSCLTDMKFNKLSVNSESVLKFAMLKGGGFLLQISPDDNLPVPVIPTTYEAEDATLTNTVVRSTEEALHASGGMMVKQVGMGQSITFENIQAEQDGQHLLTIYYATKDTRYAQLLVNNTLVEDSVVYYGNSRFTNSYNADGMSWKQIPVLLKKGSNSITIQSYANGWAPNFDRISITPLTTEEGEDGIKQPGYTPKANGRIYDLTGRQVDKMYRGIYTINGKKILNQ